MKLKNPTGAPVLLSTLGLSVDAGGTVEVTGQTAQTLTAQGWTRVDRPRKKASARKRPAKKAADPAADTTTTTTTTGASASADEGA